MRWYYAFNGQKTGPVGEAEFTQLRADGVIGPDTLVWKQGMANWQPYREVAPADAFEVPPLPAAAGGVALPAWAEKSADDARPPALNFAGFWVRVGAHLIDLLILSGVFFLLFLARGDIGALREAVTQQDADRVTKIMTDGLLRVAWAFHLIRMVYLVIFQKVFGATVGKMAVGARVVRPDGSPVGWGQMILRFFVGLICNYTMGIAYLIAAFDEEKRALHDYASRTRVVLKR